MAQTKAGNDRKPRTPAHGPRTLICEYRIASGLAQTELADAAAISLRTLQRLETGQIDNPPIRYLVSIARALDIPWVALIENEWCEPYGGSQKVTLHPDRRWELDRAAGGQARSFQDRGSAPMDARIEAALSEKLEPSRRPRPSW